MEKKFIFIINLILIFTITGIEIVKSQCFDKPVSKELLAKRSGDLYTGTIIKNYPQAVGIGMKYRFNCKAADPAISSGSTIVTIGWVNDETEESTSFWTIGKFDTELFYKTTQSRYFNYDYVVPDDAEAIKHKYLKFQYTITVSGTYMNWYRTWIVRIPVENIIYGEVKLMDVAEFPETKDYEIKPLSSSKDRIGKAILYSDAGGSYNYEEEFNENGCYKLIVKPGHLNSYIEVQDSFGSNEKISPYSYHIKNPQEGGSISTRFYSPIVKRIKDATYNINNKNVDVTAAVSGTLTGTLIQAILAVINTIYKTNYSNINIPVRNIPITGYTYDYKPINELLQKYSENFLKQYDTIGHYKGYQDDSLRAEFLVRYYYAINGIDTLYKTTQSMTIEFVKILANYAKLIPMVKEVDLASKEMIKKAQYISKALALLGITKVTLNLIKSYIDYCLNNGIKPDNSGNSEQYNLFNSIVKSYSAILDCYIKQYENIKQNNPKPDFKSLGKFLANDAIDAAAASIALFTLMPIYIANGNKYMNSIITNFDGKQNYYTELTGDHKLNYFKMTNKESYWNTIDNKNSNNSMLGQIRNDINNTITSSKNARSTVNFTQYLGDLANISYLTDGFRILLNKILTPINLGVLAPIAYMDRVGMEKAFITESCIPVKSFYPYFFQPGSFNSNYRYHGNLFDLMSSLALYNSALTGNTNKSISNAAQKQKKLSFLNTDIDKMSLLLNNIITSVRKELNNSINSAEIKDTNVINRNIIHLIELSDSLSEYSVMINHYVIPVKDSLSIIDSAFSGNYFNVLTKNYQVINDIYKFNNYLFKIKSDIVSSDNNSYKTDKDSLKFTQDTIEKSYNDYDSLINKLLGNIKQFPPKPYIFIKEIKISPDTLTTNKSILISTKIFNLSTINIDSVKVILISDSLTTVEGEKQYFIHKIGAGEEKELKWELLITKPTKTVGSYNIEISSAQTYYFYKGIFTLNITPVDTFNLEGQVLYEDNSTGKALSNVKLILKTSEEEKKDSTTTDSKGYYKFSQVKPGAYFVEPQIKKEPGGINPIDALLINRNYLSMYKISNQLMKKAADVNLDTKITPIDALMVNRRYLGIVKTFKAGNWIYEKDTVKIINDDIKYNIKAICPGDVNGNYSPPGK